MTIMQMSMQQDLVVMLVGVWHHGILDQRACAAWSTLLGRCQVVTRSMLMRYKLMLASLDGHAITLAVHI